MTPRTRVSKRETVDPAEEVMLAEEIAAFEIERLTSGLENRVATVRRERDSARTALRQAEAQNEELASQLNLIAKMEDLDPSPPKWLTPQKPSSGHKATICTILSDSHLDEVVRVEEVNGANAYNREIATMRMERYFQNVIKLARHYLAGVTYDGAVLMLGGDMFSGDIHEELQQTNEDTILGSMLYWSELLAAGIDMMANEFGKVHIPVVVGNHGRRTRKPRMKLRARDNFDWFLGQMLARQFKSDKRVTFDVPDSADCMFDVYGTSIMLTHGDQFRGGSGIAGIWSPIMKGDTKKRQRQQAVSDPYDLMVCGHWHQLTWGSGFIVNGSNKGVDEYAWLGNFNYEVPQQAMWLVTPDRVGSTVHMPVFTQDRKKEGW